MNNSRQRISRSWHDEGQNGFVLVITHHEEAHAPVYRVERNGEQLYWVETEDQAKVHMAERLIREGHQCSVLCTDWIAISQ